MRTRLCDQFGIEFPIFAFSHCRDVVAAVSKAGGFGVLGALAFSAEQLELELKWIDEHIDGKPYGVDIVMPASSVTAGQDITKEMLEQMIPEQHKKYVEDVLARYGVPALPKEQEKPETLLGWTPSGGRSQVDVALRHPIKLIVNALGPPPKDVVDHVHKHGVKVAALVGRADQAKKQVEVGVDIIVAQGTEAGGHTGEIATMVLVPEVVDAVHPTPVLAAGGIACGRQAAAALALGADGVWTGSIWMAVKESDLSSVVVEKLMAAKSSDTVRSRSMTGKPARQLKTDWIKAWEAPECPGTLQMPLQFMLVADALARIGAYAEKPETRARELAGTAIGQVVGRMNTVRSTRDVIYDMVKEYIDVVERMKKGLDEAG
ncbi:MAG TPA: nitronate monooxygenase family protein [Polyangiaceae bacterium]|nr:nitronate monooxygenase family protein [Polyangiaceae bacterium]